MGAMGSRMIVTHATKRGKPSTTKATPRIPLDWSCGQVPTGDWVSNDPIGWLNAMSQDGEVRSRTVSLLQGNEVVPFMKGNRRVS